MLTNNKVDFPLQALYIQNKFLDTHITLKRKNHTGIVYKVHNFKLIMHMYIQARLFAIDIQVEYGHGTSAYC